MLNMKKEKEALATALEENDIAKKLNEAKSAAWAIEGILRDKYNVSYEPPLRGKDCNDYLMHIRREMN